SIIYSSNVKSYAQQYNSDLRLMKNDTVSSQGDTYFLQWHYNATDDFYYYDIHLDDGTTITTIKTVKINNSMSVELDKGAGFNGLQTYLSDEIRIEFEPTSGKLVNNNAKNGAGVYRFVNKSGDDIITVSVIEQTGRVFYDE
ncbi:MAG: hypothetical protein PF505_08745, partial [Vallitaleaceae bacterium]|nr:hypothetical protein [Vallitaleaceae bacterium]